MFPSLLNPGFAVVLWVFSCGLGYIFALAPQDAASGFSKVENRKRASLDTAALVLSSGGWSYSGTSGGCLVACFWSRSSE